MLQSGAITRKTALNLRDLIRLCKPRITALIVFTAFGGFVVASPDFPPLPLTVATLVGIGLVSSAAAVFNAVLEQHSDGRMKRTRRRPLPANRLKRSQAILFGVVLCVLGLALLYIWANTLTVWLTFTGFVGYAAVYTALLKPATSQNIVLGGASGALPPVLGWAAATNQVSVEAWVLFLIIFLWTPPHFWALALFHKHDYATAGVPMLPVVKGEDYTRRAIVAYVLCLLPVSALPYLLGTAGNVYAVVCILLGMRFIHRAWLLYVRPSDRLAFQTFKFSVTYLFLLFVALVVDHFVSLF